MKAVFMFEFLRLWKQVLVFLNTGVVIIRKKHIVLLIIIVFILFNGVRLYMAQQEENALREDTISHLEEKGYDIEAHIEETVIVNAGKDERMKAVVVTFKDEPAVHYFYSYKQDTDQIVQVDAVHRETNQPLKHLEDE
ncbi:hypothetical protein [Virgibacillus kimchii]